MVHLIDILLVTAIVGAAFLAFIKYFRELGKAPENGQAISCAGCNSSCHTDIPENPSLLAMQKIIAPKRD